MTLVSVTAYHSFGGEVEASNTPTIRRLTPSCRHQLLRIARLSKRGSNPCRFALPFCDLPSRVSAFFARLPEEQTRRIGLVPRLCGGSSKLDSLGQIPRCCIVMFILTILRGSTRSSRFPILVVAKIGIN